ncbi:HDIG domain-containing protein [Nocardiopsis sp. EMB25]|uniref:HD domain-containing protein n=1 Tax=Nocardiopsis sp. EMB25 TaxID=2835867 RepID=UPI0022834B0F|nr:HD domain-containing protein [Nocardiopsis sp. EMB25]MCY9783765.1 HDIG domain-containing protein [Nocardiopsis sp. EMB25]
MRIPTDARIRDLHEKYAPTPEAFALVHRHCRIVRDIAERLLERCPEGLDAELVRAGSLLHDIGVYALYDDSGRIDHANYVRHGVLGRDILAEEGFPEEIQRFCSCHTGVGVSRSDVLNQGLPIPVDDYLAESPEEELVMFADKFHSKTDPPVFVSRASYEERLRRFGENKVLRFKEMVERFGEPDLAPIMATYGDPLV